MFRFQRIRPRRIAFAGANISAVTANFTTLALFNNSATAEYLLVRAWSASLAVSGRMVAGVANINFGGTAIAATPFLPTEAPPPGLVTSSTPAAAQTNGYYFATVANAVAFWPVSMPFCILPQGWSFFLQANQANQNLIGGVMWEAIKPEQLDEGAWLQANAALIGQNG